MGGLILKASLRHRRPWPVTESMGFSGHVILHVKPTILVANISWMENRKKNTNIRGDLIYAL